MNFIELLGIDSSSFKFKLIRLLSSVPSEYSVNELSILLEKVFKGESIRFEFNLPIDKARDFAYELVKHGFSIGDSSIHEDDGY